MPVTRPDRRRLRPYHDHTMTMTLEGGVDMGGRGGGCRAEPYIYIYNYVYVYIWMEFVELRFKSKVNGHAIGSRIGLSS